jgi:phosphoribosylamine--glycine ligase
MGDPETEVVLPRINNDLVALFVATAQQQLNSTSVKMDSRSAATIVAVSGGYPGDYDKGIPIVGLGNTFEKEVLVFHAGTKKEGDQIVTDGGRVLCITALADNLDDAIYKCNETIDAIDFDKKYFRRDIGFEFIKDMH